MKDRVKTTEAFFRKAFYDLTDCAFGSPLDPLLPVEKDTSVRLNIRKSVEGDKKTTTNS